MWVAVAAIGVITTAVVSAALLVRKVAKELDEHLALGNVYGLFSQSEMVAMNYNQPDAVSVALLDGRAYWIEGNSLMVAPADDEEVDFSLAVQYNAMEADSKELPKILFILDALKEDS
jgi:hypothetical protein